MRTTRDVRRALVSTEYGSVHVESVGSGPPLVLLHMSPLSGRMFDQVVGPLSAAHQVVTVDRLGFGVSDRGVTGMTLPDHARATLEALAGFQIQEFDIVGIHSGSTEAIEMACQQPERIRSVTVVGLVVLTRAEAEVFRPTVDAPAPVRSGRHLQWYWGYWDHVRSISSTAERWPAELTHSRVVDHLSSWPDAKATYDAVFDYATRNRLPEVIPPLLVLCPKDEFWDISRRTRPTLPPQARFIELPDIDYEAFTFGSERLIQEICKFIESI